MTKLEKQNLLIAGCILTGILLLKKGGSIGGVKKTQKKIDLIYNNTPHDYRGIASKEHWGKDAGKKTIMYLDNDGVTKLNLIENLPDNIFETKYLKALDRSKSQACRHVLQLLDKGVDYSKAVNQAVYLFDASRKDLEKELETYI